jgi:hypothetical protein
MTQLSKDRFLKAIRDRTPEGAARTLVLSRTVPHCFTGAGGLYQTFLDHIATCLGVSTDFITVVGSAKMGFALAPDAFPRPYSGSSDVDVVVINEQLFDQGWLSLLQWLYARRRSIGRAERNWLGRLLGDISQGFFAPDFLGSGIVTDVNLAAFRSLRASWVTTFNSLATAAPALAPLTVHGRLFRSEEHAVLYYADTLHKILQREEAVSNEV